MDKDIIRTGPGTRQPALQLEFNIEEEYLKARTSGVRTRAAVTSILNQIAQTAVENQRGKILIDVRELEGRLGVLDSYYLVTRDFQHIRGIGIKKVAIIDRPLPKLSDYFLETVSHNRGFNLRIFQNPDAALDWLLGPKGPPEKTEIIP